MPDASPRTTRVIFVNRFYWPDEPATAQLLTDLATRLAALGHEVVVIARHPGDAGTPRREIREGVTILRVRSSRLTRLGLAGKAVDFATFFFAAFFWMVRTAGSGDVLVALTDPPLIGVGAWLAARLRGARLFHWVQDIYPELAMELAGQRWLRVSRPLRNAAWRGADRNITLGHDMAEVLSAAGVTAEKISIVPNWGPRGLVPPAAGATDSLRTEWGLAGKFVVAYSGNFGRVHDLVPVLAVAEALKNDPAIVFVMIGGGAQRDALQQEAGRRGLGNVVFKPAQPRARLAETLGVGDVHLVTLRPGCERYVFPSKLYGIAAVARPVIFIGPHGSDISQQIAAGGFGFAFSAPETAAIAQAIRSLHADASTVAQLGGAAARFAQTAGALENAAEQWHRLLTAPAGGLAATGDRS
ncbi:MAG TPA: glycosyltransferase family 4 protein [Opitutaceae bacterium]|nr:glycosyltransferase family 4 protein [Opitutaceae bacterium]